MPSLTTTLIQPLLRHESSAKAIPFATDRARPRACYYLPLPREMPYSLIYFQNSVTILHTSVPWRLIMRVTLCKNKRTNKTDNKIWLMTALQGQLVRWLIFFKKLKSRISYGLFMQLKWNIDIRNRRSTKTTNYPSSEEVKTLTQYQDMLRTPIRVGMRSGSIAVIQVWGIPAPYSALDRMT